MTERNSVTIQSEIMERPFTYQGKEFTNYEFKAQIEDSETAVKFQSTSKDIAGVITQAGVGSKVELEYTTTVKGDFTNRKVAQVYREGRAQVAPKIPGSTRSYGKTPEEQASIERQVDKYVTATIYGDHIEKGVPFNEKLMRQIFKVVESLGKSVVETAKKDYGAVDAS